MSKRSVVLKFMSIVLMVCTFLIFIVPFSGVEASTYPGGRNRGASPQAYYTDSVAQFGYTANYDRGRAYWNTHPRVNIQRTFNLSTQPDRYFVSATFQAGLLGRIFPYGRNGNQVGSGEYWQYVSVYMYANQMRGQSNYQSSAVSYNAAHEIGHTIKLGHQPLLVDSVMAQGFRPIPSSLTNPDRTSVNRKWPN